MSWIFYAFLVAIISAIITVLNKTLVNKLHIITVSTLLTAIVGTGAGIYIVLNPSVLNTSLSTAFWQLMILDTALSVAAFLFLMRGIQKDSVSLVTPLLAFTPIFIVFFELVFYKTLPSLHAWIGIILIVAGGYTIHNTSIRNYLKSSGTKFVFATALIWGLTSVLDKMLVELSSPIISALIFQITRGLIMFGVFVVWQKLYKPNSTFRKLNIGVFVVLLVVAFAHFLESYFQNQAISGGFVSYVIGIKRTSILFTIIFGVIFLKEKVTTKFVGITILMLCGVFLIVI